MMQCEHIHGDGARCLSPAMHRRSFCYLHWRQREHKLSVPEAEFQLPAIDSEASVVVASVQIADAVLAGKLDPKRARIVIACLKIAIDSLRRQQDVSGVTELELTPAMEKELVGTEKNDVGTDLPVCPTRAQLAVSTTEDQKKNGEGNLFDAARPRAASTTSKAEESASATNGLDDVDTGFQARVGVAPATPSSKRPAVEPWVSVTSTFPSPAAPPDKKLSAHQLKLMKKILRHGPRHPQFHLAARLVDHHIADAS